MNAKSILLLFSITLSCNALAQVEVYRYIRSTTEQYPTSQCDKNPIGIFARGSYVKVIATESNAVYVETKSQSVGYIKKGYLVEHLNGSDKYEEDPPIFKGGIDGSYFENRGLYTNVAGLRARAEPSTSGLVIKQLNMNHRCDVDFIPYDPNGWVCGGTLWDGEGDFTFYVPVKYVGKQTDIRDIMAIYSSKKGKNMQEDKLLAERILEMSYWEGDSIRLEALLIFKDLISSYNLTVPLDKIEFEIFALQTIGVSNSYLDNELKYHYLLGGQKLKLESAKDIDLLNLIYTKSSDFPEQLGECGWGFESAYYLPGITVIDEGDDYGFTVWKIDFTNSDIKIVVNGFEISSRTSEIEFIKGLRSAITFSGLRDGEHSYQLGNDGEYLVLKFVDGKIVLWEVGYQC